MKTITIASLSGGQGKTTTAYFLARSLAENFRVLAIDADPQASLTFYLQHQVEEDQPTLLEVLKKTVEVEDGIYPTPTDNLFLIPADRALNQAQEYLAGSGAGALVLSRRLRDVQSLFDFCIIDAPPQETQICLSAIAAADWLTIPIEATVKGANSLVFTLDAIAKLKDVADYEGEILGILPFRDRWFGYSQSKDCREALAAAKHIAEDIPFFPSVRESEQIKKAMRFGNTLDEDLNYPFAQMVEAIALLQSTVNNQQSSKDSKQSVVGSLVP